MSTAFNTEEYNLAYPDGVENNYWTITRLHVLYNTICNLSQAKNIIEIGCGKGIVVNHLRSKGLTIYGCELADVPVLDGVKQFIHANMDANKMPDAFRFQFDTMLLLDVIEHIENEKDFLNTLLANYPNVKHVIITVPSRLEIWSNYDEFYGHFRRYSLHSLTQLLTSCNLQTGSLKYFFHSLYLPALLQKKLNIKREIKIASPKGISKTIHKMLASFFKAEAALIPNSFYGTSIIAVANRLA